MGYFFPKISSFKFLVFSYSNWARCIDSHISISGSCFFLASKQQTISQFFSEVEHMALFATICELQWSLYLLTDLTLQCDHPLVLYCDNQSALHIIANPIFHEKTKYLEINYHLNNRMKEKESLNEYFNRFSKLINQMKSRRDTINNQRIVYEIMNSLIENFDHVVAIIEETKDL
ncbi:Copia protein, partial [Mucuna pruriens]